VTIPRVPRRREFVPKRPHILRVEIVGQRARGAGYALRVAVLHSQSKEAIVSLKVERDGSHVLRLEIRPGDFELLEAAISAARLANRKQEP
jgi:hypothetical protein